jgi:hypothetical protein
MFLLLAGMIAMGFAVAGLFFFRFWSETHDRLFVFFALAFFVLSANRIALAFVVREDEIHTMLYWVRFLAFLFILIAIIDKNRSVGPHSAGPNQG